MKTFLKWLHEIKFPHLGGKLGGIQYEYCGDAWRAALEHILKDCVLPSGMISHGLIEKEVKEWDGKDT